MKKLSLLFLTLLSVYTLVFPIPVFATEDGDDGDVIDLTILLPGESNNRSQVEVPLHAMHYAAPDRVTVSFSHDIGNVTVQITNLSYSTSSTLYLDSSVSYQIIPISGGSGFYRIEFVLSEGEVYYGLFSVL